jgi:hypothetical protein
MRSILAFVAVSLLINYGFIEGRYTQRPGFLELKMIDQGASLPPKRWPSTGGCLDRVDGHYCCPHNCQQLPGLENLLTFCGQRRVGLLKRFLKLRFTILLNISTSVNDQQRASLLPRFPKPYFNIVILFKTRTSNNV